MEESPSAKLLTEREASTFLGVTQAELQYRRFKNLPPNFLVRSKHIYYSVDELRFPFIPIKKTNGGVLFSTLRVKLRELSRLNFESFTIP